MHSSQKSWRTHILILGAYLLLALLLTWPLALNVETHVPGNGVDDPPLTWNLWWVQHALIDLGINPFDSDYLFYPLGINLSFYTLTVLNGLLSIPLQAIFGLIPASNLLLLSSFVLGGYGAFLLALFGLDPCQHERDDADQRRPVALSLYAGAFLAGLLYAFSSSKLAYAALGQWNIASSQWIPFYVLYLFKVTEHPRRWRYALLAALFLLLQAYAELTYATFLVLFTGLWLVWQVFVHRRALRSAQLGRLVTSLVFVGLLAVVGLAPMLAMMIPDMIVEGDVFAEGGGFSDVFSADLLGFLVPTMYHPALGTLVERFRFDHTVGQHIYVGVATLVLAVVGLVYWARGTGPELAGEGSDSAKRPGGAGAVSHGARSALWVKFWSLSALVFWLMTLGPTLRVNGQATSLPLPFSLLAQLPFLKGNRYPSRYSVLLVLSLAMLAAFGLLAILRTLRKRPSATLKAATLLLVALLLFEQLSIPLPLSDMRVPEVYEIIASEVPGEYTLLDLPVAWRNGSRVTGTEHPLIMFEQYYQSAHGKRVLAGNTSRNPPLKFQYFVESPVISTIIALETGHEVGPEIVEQDRILAPEVLRFLDIQAIVIHPEETGPGMIPYIEGVMPVQRIYEDSGIVAYGVKLPPWPETRTIAPGNALGRLSFAEGWGTPAQDTIWAQRRAARLLVPLNGGAQEMVFRAYSPEGGQRLTVEVNGQPVQYISMAAGWMEYEFPVPAKALQPGLNEIWLRFEELVPASQVRLSPRAIGHTGVESPVNLVVQSAGLEVGDFGHIYVDGRNVSLNQRGYNVAVLDPQSGVVEQIAAFDTHLDEGASRALAGFLSGVPPGHIVAVAAADEASRLLGEDAVAALQGIGAAGDLRNKTRWGHSIIGVQGASPGAALEALDWMQPVVAVAGEGATEPNLAAAFSSFGFKPIEGQPD